MNRSTSYLILINAQLKMRRLLQLIKFQAIYCFTTALFQHLNGLSNGKCTMNVLSNKYTDNSFLQAQIVDFFAFPVEEKISTSKFNCCVINH